MPDEPGKENMPISEQQPREMGSEKLTQRELKPIAGGASWLYEKQEDLVNITNEDLRSAVEILEQTQPNSASLLREHYWDILNLVKAKKVEFTDTKPFLDKIAARIDDLEQQTMTRQAEVTQDAIRRQTEASYDVFINAVYRQEPVAIQFETFPPSWFREMTPEEQVGVRALTYLANAAYIKRNSANINLEKTKDNPYLTALDREGTMAIWEMPGVEPALRYYLRELFEGEYVAGTRGRLYYELRIKKEVSEDIRRTCGITRQDETEAAKKGEKVLKDLISGAGILSDPERFRRFRGLLQNRLREGKVVEDEWKARAADAAAWNLLYVGNTAESADLERRLTPSTVYGEQVRSMMHPFAKARSKVFKEKQEVGTEEGWGGAIGNWLADRVAYDGDFRRRFDNGEISAFPRTMFASLFELVEVDELRDPKTRDKGNKTIAEKLMAGEPLNWDQQKKEPWGVYGDLWDTTYRGYLYATGKNELDIKNWHLWCHQLADIIGKIKGSSLGKYYEDPSFLLFAICNSAGLRSYTSGLLLDSGVATEGIYGKFVESIVNYPRLVESPKNREWIKQMLNTSAMARIRVDLNRSREFDKRRKSDLP